MANDYIKTLRTEVQTMVNQAKALHAQIVADGEKATEADQTKLNNLIDAGEKKRAELEQLEKLEAMDAHVNGAGAGAGEGKNGRKTTDSPDYEEQERLNQLRSKGWGQMITESKEYKNGEFKDGKKVQVGAALQRKALYNATDATGGYLVREQRIEMVDLMPFRPRSVIDLINLSQTTADAVEYVTINGRTNAAAPVAEYSGGNFGAKPESNLTFNKVAAAVKTIATWIAASRQIMMDAPNLQNLVDVQLTQMVEEVLENQVISGDGTGDNLLGILNTSGIQTRTQNATTPVGRGQTATDTLADTLRRAITDLYLEFYRPDGIVLHPTQGEALELLKDANDQYLRIYDSASLRVWRVPVVETPAITAGTALVGAFKIGATLWDRMQTEVRYSENYSDYFIRNAVVVLAELRAAFGVQRPKAFEKITIS